MNSATQSATGTSAGFGIGWHNFVLTNAAANPDAPAWVGPSETLSFKQLAWRATKFAAQLRREGVEQDAIVMVRMPKEFEFVFALALSMIGATAVSNTAKQYYDFEPNTDWLLTRQAIEDYPAQKQIIITPPWQQRAFNNLEPFNPIGLKSPRSVARVALTSGTTGRPKAVAFLHEDLIKRVTLWGELFPAEGADWHLSDMGTVGGALRPVVAMAAGHPSVHLGASRDPRQVVALSHRTPPTYLGGSSVQIEQFLNHFLRTPFNFSKLRGVRTGGSTVPSRLQTLVRERFGFYISIVYGSTELGFGTARDGDPSLPAQHVGWPSKGSEIQVVDSNNQPVPVGEIGRVRAKTQYMATEYWRDPDATAKYFSDGWFYPGDIGQLLPDGALMLGGRETELINLGGIKIDPYLIDELARHELRVTEVAAFGFAPNGGTDRLGIAIAGVENVKTKSFEKALAKKYPVRNEIFYLYLRELPRNGMAKVERKTLAALAAARH